MKERMVTIRHPELDVESVVIDESVPVWLKNGWEVVGTTEEGYLSSEEVAGEADVVMFDLEQDNAVAKPRKKE